MTILFKEGCSTPVNLGEKGENKVTAIQFDYSAWIEEYGNGAISLLVKRKGDSSAYPVVLTTADGIATWTISDTDTAVQGYGKAEYIFTIDDKVAKSAVFSFFVAQDLGAAGDPPDPYESWIDTLTALGGETLINAQAAQAAQSGAETAQTAAETAATNAATSATNAAQSAGAARFAAESALASSDSASASATTATASASAASASATQAAASASAAEASETAAYDSANTAAEEAEVARTAATTATTAATNASASAQSASDSATAASGSASSASASATTATQAATSATTSANNAAQSASAASGSATQAASSATNAASSATSASGSASAAATSATNAAQSATDAEASAQEAAEQAAKLNNYLPTDTASGAIASFSDGAEGVPVEALTVSLEPVQDLHGQSSPYPSGGGKNKFSPTPYMGLSYGIAVGTSISLTDGDPVTVNGNSITYDVASWGYRNFKTAPLSAGTYHVYIDISAITNPRFTVYVVGNDDVIKEMDNYSQVINVSKTLVDGDYFVVYAGSNTAQTLTFTNWQIESGSSYTAWSPYENICPITGHTACEVWRSGKNLYDKDNHQFAQYSQYNPAVCWTSPFLLKSGTYTFKCTSGFGNCYLNVYANYADAIANTNRVLQLSFLNGAPLTRSFDSDVYVRLQQNSTGGTAEDYALVTDSWQVELGSTATDYETPNVQHISIPLGQTVYGGTVDVVGGVCTVDRAISTFTWGSYLAEYAPEGNAFKRRTFPLSTTLVEGPGHSITNCLGVYTTSVPTTTPYFYVSNPYAYFWLPVDTASDFEIQLVGELATPITIDLTDIPTISTLLGQNNIWSDSGDVDVTYRADIQLYISKMIAEALA